MTFDLLQASSGLREIVAIYWMLRALESRLPRRVVVFTDSQVACSAISRGSRVYTVQYIARLIFAWCLHHSVCLFPCWAPRTTDIISVADERSRWSDTYGQCTPERVFTAANQLALRLWASPLSFDRQASHLNAMPPAHWGCRPSPSTLFGTNPARQESTCSCSRCNRGGLTSTSSTRQHCWWWTSEGRSLPAY